MLNMIDEICAEVHNYFLSGTETGTFTIDGGRLDLPHFLQKGQYFRIIGSVFNDGVHCYDDELKLKDETFDGAVWAMAVPPTFLELCNEITEWQESKAGQAAKSPFTSESFGGYSYTKATDDNGAGLTWQAVFAKRLNRWRKLPRFY